MFDKEEMIRMKIEELVYDICSDISRRGHASNYPEIVDLIAEFLDDNYENYFEEEVEDAE